MVDYSVHKISLLRSMCQCLSAIIVHGQVCCADVVECWTRRQLMFAEKRTSRYVTRRLANV